VPPGVVDFASEMLGATPLAVISDFLPTFDNHDKADAVAVLQRCATLLVGAEQDLMTPVEHTRAMARALPGAQVTILDPGGHLSILEHPDRVNSDLRELFDDAWALAGKRGLR
jgi:pimeloyl-ACP methyl ester carboxylesterase